MYSTRAEIWKEICREIALTRWKKPDCYLVGAGVAFGDVVAISDSGNGHMIEHSERIAQWKQAKVDSIVEDLNLGEIRS